MYALSTLTLISTFLSVSANPFLDTLASQMRFLMANAKAPGTKKTNMSQLKSWFRYCQLAQIPRLPVGGWHLAMYVTSLVVSGKVKSAGSLANYVSTVRGYHRDMGYDCPTPSQFGPLQRVIDGARRLACRPIKKSLPITPKILINFLRTVLPPPFCPYKSQTLTTFKILSLLYFLTMLRCSSLIPTSYGEVDPLRLVCWGGVKFLEYNGVSGVLITVRKTKTIQCGERVQKVPLARNDAFPLLCPLRAVLLLRDIIGEHNITEDTPIFQTRDYQGVLRPILRHQYENWFNFRLNEMGEDARLYTLHAWRHGGIQQTLLSEHNLALAKLTSDHTSDVILEYAQVPADRRLTISQKINVNLTRAVMGEHQDIPNLPQGVLQLV